MKQRILVLLFIFISVLSFGDIEIVPGKWDFGWIQEGIIIDKEIKFTNNGPDQVHIEIIPTCDCVYSQPAEFTLSPGESSTVLFIFDSTDESGEQEKMLIIKTDLEGFERKFYSVTGMVGDGGESTVREITQPDTTGSKSDVEMDYYYFPNCSQCRKFINTTIPGLEKELTISILLNKKDINDPEMYTEYVSRLKSLGEKERAVPVLIIGKKVLQGSNEIDKQLKDEIKHYLEFKGEGTDEIFKDQEDSGLAEKMAILPAIGAGLLDGINPCAFATLISLLAALALAGKRRKEILVIGIFFTLSVFITYFMVGIGVFKVIQAASIFPLVAQIIHWVLFGVLVVFAGLSLYDFYLIKKGRSKEMILQLPDTFKKKIQKTIKTKIRSAAIVLSTV